MCDNNELHQGVKLNRRYELYQGIGMRAPNNLDFYVFKLKFFFHSGYNFLIVCST